MKKPIIAGIQQMGVGNPSVYEAFAWYRKAFKVDVPVFDEAATAALMLPYTGGEPRDRHAVLALSMQGGGGMEIWQYTSRVPEYPKFEIRAGDLGIFVAKIKSKDVQATYQHFKKEELSVIGEVSKMPNGKEHCFVKDPYNNIFEIVPSEDWYISGIPSTGGIYGGILGVTDIEKSKAFYKDILGYDTVVYDESGTFDDLKDLPGGNGKFRRVLLTHSQARKGPFSQMFGTSEIELLQVLDRTPNKIFADRLWGDIGFIHLCFDIQGMKAMEALCESKGYPFTVDSSKAAESKDGFDMGEAAGHFTYIEDPDGTLIEFVEAHKVPIAKKIGWYLDLKKRNPEKALPKWMLRAMGWNRVKD